MTVKLLHSNNSCHSENPQQNVMIESTYHSLIHKVSNEGCSRNANGLIIALEATSKLDDKPV
jgi:hypothetical protein